MTWEEVKENLRQFKTLGNTLKDTEEALEELEESEVESFSTEFTSREERLYEKAEEFESILMTLDQGILSVDLTDRELVVVEFIIMGKSLRWIARNIFASSHTVPERNLNSASKKIAQAINAQG